MGLLDGALNMLGGNQDQTPDARTRLIQATLGMLTDSSQGGLHGLVERFEQAGLGNAVSSWIGTEDNVPVTPEQIQETMGNNGSLQQLADAAGIAPDHAAGLLSALLPIIVDKLTPAGHIPQGGLAHMSELLGHFIKL